MSQYYTNQPGGQNRPPQKKNDPAWFSWPLIIVLFALGLWPVGLVLLVLKLVEDDKKKVAARKHAAAAQAAAAAAARARTAETRRYADDVDARVDAAVERALEMVEASRTGRTTAAQAASARQAAAARQAASARQAAYRQPVPPVQPAASRKKEKKPKLKHRFLSILLMLIGISLVTAGSIWGLASLIDMVNYYSSYLLADFLGAVSMSGIGGILWGTGHHMREMNRRSQRYMLAIGDADAMPLDEIACRVNRTKAQAARELQKLIDKGYLGEDAYVDRKRGYFLRFGASPEPEKKAEPAPVREQPPAEEKAAEPAYEGILQGFRAANDRIDDPELSAKIDRLEQISRLIFREVEEHPEKRDRIHTFFDYYLPTTQKLLDAYAEFEETGVDGEHLREAKVRIEQTMDAIVEGFEHQLDQLYSTDAMDVVSDIKVMETMLHRDTASVAKDFGYAEEPKKRTPPPGKEAHAADQQQVEMM